MVFNPNQPDFQSMEIHHLLIRVNSCVARHEEMTGEKLQMPQIQSQLTKQLFFKPKETPVWIEVTICYVKYSDLIYSKLPQFGRPFYQ